MYYSEETINYIKKKTNIVDVISEHILIVKKQNNYWGLCPFHQENYPSFMVSESKQTYFCFGCGNGGNVFSFLMNYKHLTFPETVKYLADRINLKLPEMEYAEEDQRRIKRRKMLYKICEEASGYFHYLLRTDVGNAGYQYLTNRELSDETINHFDLGFAGKKGVQLVRYLKKKGYKEDIISEAGLAMFSDKVGMSSQFWNRVMFPIQDINNKIIGFGGRIIGDGEPKYLNSPETPIFDKRKNLYALNFSRAAASKTGNIILCEGYMDVIAMHQAGFTQAVASLGTALTSEQAILLRRYTDSVLLAYDSDAAGTQAAIRAYDILQEAGLTCKVIDLTPYKDPDEFIKKLGKEAFQKRIDNAEDGFSFIIRKLEPIYSKKEEDFTMKVQKELVVELIKRK